MKLLSEKDGLFSRMENYEFEIPNQGRPYNKGLIICYHLMSSPGFYEPDTTKVNNSVST